MTLKGRVLYLCLKNLVESTNILPRKECCLTWQTISGVLEAPGSFIHKPRLKILHERRYLGPLTLSVLQFCVCSLEQEAHFPAPLFQLLLPADQATLEMDGEVPQGQDSERGHHCVRGGSEDWQRRGGASRPYDVRQITSFLWARKLSPQLSI